MQARCCALSFSCGVYSTGSIMLQCPSLNQRIYKSKLRYPFQYPQAVIDSRSKKFKQWSEDVMKKAINAVINDGFSIRRAAEDYDIPKSTLGDRIL